MMATRRASKPKPRGDGKTRTDQCVETDSGACPVRKMLDVMTDDGGWETVLVQSTGEMAMVDSHRSRNPQVLRELWREVSRDGTPGKRLFYQSAGCAWPFESAFL